VLASGPELGGQGTRLRRLGVVAVLGGVLGGVLLLITPPGVFTLIVPWLIALGSLAILVGRAPRQAPGDGRAGDAIGLTVGRSYVCQAAAGASWSRVAVSMVR